MKPLIVYQSRTGNTRKVANAIAGPMDADVVSIEDVHLRDFRDRTLVGFGCGVYWTRVDARIFRWAAVLSKQCKIFVFITSGFGARFMLRLYWYFVQRQFARLGLTLAGTWNCRGYDQHPLSKWMGLSKGHPNAGDLESAGEFSRRMLAAAARAEAVETLA